MLEYLDFVGESSKVVFVTLILLDDFHSPYVSCETVDNLLDLSEATLAQKLKDLVILSNLSSFFLDHVVCVDAEVRNRHRSCIGYRLLLLR